MINYLSKKSERKNLEEKMKIFEKKYIIKARGNQEINVHTQNDIVYIRPGDYTTIEDVMTKENVQENFIRATKNFIFLKIEDNIYKVSYEPTVSH